jgi:hypothetical protein
MLEDSDAGQLISRTEYIGITQSSWPGNATQAMVDALIQRLNNSVDETAASSNTIDHAQALATGNAIADYCSSASDVR